MFILGQIDLFLFFRVKTHILGRFTIVIFSRIECQMSGKVSFYNKIHHARSIASIRLNWVPLRCRTGASRTLEQTPSSQFHETDGTITQSQLHFTRWLKNHRCYRNSEPPCWVFQPKTQRFPSSRNLDQWSCCHQETQEPFRLWCILPTYARTYQNKKLFESPFSLG